jgi:hypothetical protein
MATKKNFKNNTRYLTGEKNHYKYIPLLFIKVVGKKFGSHIHHLEATINIWELLEKKISVGNQVGRTSSSIKFYFVKNGIEDKVR